MEISCSCSCCLSRHCATSGTEPSCRTCGTVFEEAACEAPAFRRLPVKHLRVALRRLPVKHLRVAALHRGTTNVRCRARRSLAVTLQHFGSLERGNDLHPIPKCVAVCCSVLQCVAVCCNITAQGDAFSCTSHFDILCVPFCEMSQNINWDADHFDIVCVPFCEK